MKGGALIGLGASLALHGAALGALLLLAPQPRVAPMAEQGVTLLWERQEEGVAALAEAALPPPPLAEPPPSLPTPPVASIIEPAPQPISLAALPAPPVAAPQPLTPEPSRQAAPQPRPRPAQPAPRQATAPAEAPPPLVVGAGVAVGAVTQARVMQGPGNPPPEYPVNSRVRGEQGRVTLLVSVDAEGRVADLSVQASSGFRLLDEAAERAVRRWRFEPAMRDGRPVLSTLPVGITFQLEGVRRW